MWIFIVVFTVLGIVALISPRSSWYMSNWWRFEGEVEPSAGSLIFYRLGGFIFLVIGIVLLSKVL
ncbi:MULTISPECIES: DUF6199 family natural product biosynthesis protein [Paenibacillus]|jgi:hypothetical protein|uniref:DUF6199 family natural product biosynthesis protein n=1 Tax=Paenibacillus TaxID=44249 RepID=UPI0004F73FED|nr:hypothetical protein P40081_25715 [Paenibacillus sp. FSL P4-0081]KHL92889.1 hypothetical protein QW71_26580 [Paenibacillus sp. IHB B 3415]OMF27375.1 hypothetical protein BK132_17565 [Paenibacillus sp. FSL H8-0259]